MAEKIKEKKKKPVTKTGRTSSKKSSKKKKSTANKVDKDGFKKGERLQLWKATQQALSIALIGRGYKIGGRFNTYASLLYKEVLENKSQYIGKKNFASLLKFVRRNAYQIVTQTQETRKWALDDGSIRKEAMMFYDFQDEISKDDVYGDIHIIFQSHSDDLCDFDSFEGTNQDVVDLFENIVKPYCRREYGNSYAQVVYADSGIDQNGKKWLEYRLETAMVNNPNAREIVQDLKGITRTPEDTKQPQTDLKEEQKTSAKEAVEIEKIKSEERIKIAEIEAETKRQSNTAKIQQYAQLLSSKAITFEQFQQLMATV